MKTKMLFVISALGAGGAEKSLVNLLHLLDYSRYDVDLLLFKKEGVFYSQIPDAVNILQTPEDLHFLFHFPSKKDQITKTALRGAVCRMVGSAYKKIVYGDKRDPGMQARWRLFYGKALGCLDGKYDVAVAYMHGEAMYYVAEKVIADKKITWIHNDYKALQLDPKKDLPYLQQFDKIVTISDECAEIFTECFPEFTPKMKVLPNLTSSETVKGLADSYYPSEYQSCVTEHKAILVSVGRLCNQKGFDIAIKIAALLKKRAEKFCWFILGQGEMKDQLIRDIEKYDVEDCVKLIGIRENPYPYLKNADIVVQPSRFEGKSVVIDEAKILCKPIVVANYPTVGDQITDGLDGVIAELDEEVFSHKLAQVLHSAELQERLTAYLNGTENGNADEIQKYYYLFE